MSRKNPDVLLFLLLLCLASTLGKHQGAKDPERYVARGPALECPLCSSDRIQRVYMIRWGCTNLDGDLVANRKERDQAVARGYHVDHGGYNPYNRSYTWFCSTCNGHFGSEPFLVETEDFELKPSRTCRSCDTPTYWRARKTDAEQ